jgi:phosphoribosylglycinamide formyltransferase-1
MPEWNWLSWPGSCALSPNVQQQAIDYGARFSGCTVHFLDSGVDTGPIIIQAVVPVLPDDTVDSLSARILEQEHCIYPRAIQLLAKGRVHVNGRLVTIDPPCPPEAMASTPVLILEFSLTA